MDFAKAERAAFDGPFDQRIHAQHYSAMIAMRARTERRAFSPPPPPPDRDNYRGAGPDFWFEVAICAAAVISALGVAAHAIYGTPP